MKVAHGCKGDPALDEERRGEHLPIEHEIPDAAAEIREGIGLPRAHVLAVRDRGLAVADPLLDVALHAMQLVSGEPAGDAGVEMDGVIIEHIPPRERPFGIQEPVQMEALLGLKANGIALEVPDRAHDRPRLLLLLVRLALRHRHHRSMIAADGHRRRRGGLLLPHIIIRMCVRARRLLF